MHARPRSRPLTLTLLILLLAVALVTAVALARTGAHLVLMHYFGHPVVRALGRLTFYHG
jgi:hypothetical protein